MFTNLAIVYMTLLIVKTVIIYIRNILNQKLGLKLETDLRIATFEKLLELDSRTLHEFNTGELLTTINSDTIMFKEMFCRIIPNIFDSLYMLLITAVVLVTIDPYLLIIPFIVTPLFVIALVKFQNVARENFQCIRGANSKMSLTVQENIEAVRVVRAFTNEAIEKEKFNQANEQLQNSYIEQIKLSSAFEALFSILKQFAYVGSIVIAAFLVINGHLMIGSLAAVTSYVFKIMDFITQLNNMLFQMQQQLVSGQKMYKFMTCQSNVPDGEEKISNIQKIDISISNGSLVIEGKQVLKNINIEIPYGKKIGIVGGTGSGKSVLLEALLRIHDMTGGSIVLNGKDVRKYELEELRKGFSYVFQDVFLFSNTIDSNIAYSEPYVSQQQVVTAAKHAQAHGFIKTLADGYETIVGEKGLGISGGQRQRVSIARALLKDAPIIVLDDATSALDRTTEKKLLDTIQKYYAERTLIISAHRLSSVVNCDEILYMQDGMIVERGSFEELMREDGHFAKVYRIQENKEKFVIKA